MRRLFYIAAAAMAVFSACTKDGIEGNETKHPVFKATIEGTATKTSLAEGGKVNWENGDEVFMLFVSEIDDKGMAAYIYGANPGDDATTATLKHKSDVLVLDPKANQLIMAVYPASMVSPEGDVVFPATQTYNGEDISFAPMFYTLAFENGETPTNNKVFKNGAALLKITVPHEQMTNLTSITVSSDLVMNGEVSFDGDGYVYISTDEDDDSFPEVTPENSKITLNIPNGIAIPAEGKSFYIAILPMSEHTQEAQADHYGYLQIDVTDGTTTKSMRTKKDGGIQVDQNKIYNINFAENYTPAPVYEYVDLGLSVKWATMNIGASSPEEYGDYFAWGDTSPKGEYSRWYYRFCYGANLNQLTKYCTISSYGKNSFTDDKTVLDPEDDAAHVNWGGDWRMPTSSELAELNKNCNQTWYPVGNTEFNGVAGFKFQSLISGFTDKWIFLPATGFYDEKGYHKNDEALLYWSSSLEDKHPNFAYKIEVTTNYGGISSKLRDEGLCIRPVCK